MTLQSSGQISIYDIIGEFGGVAPFAIETYYKGAGHVPDIPANWKIPYYGEISIWDFYGASRDTNSWTTSWITYVTTSKTTTTSWTTSWLTLRDLTSWTTVVTKYIPKTSSWATSFTTSLSSGGIPITYWSTSRTTSTSWMTANGTTIRTTTVPIDMILSTSWTTYVTTLANTSGPFYVTNYPGPYQYWEEYIAGSDSWWWFYFDPYESNFNTLAPDSFIITANNGYYDVFTKGEVMESWSDSSGSYAYYEINKASYKPTSFSTSIVGTEIWSTLLSTSRLTQRQVSPSLISWTTSWVTSTYTFYYTTGNSTEYYTASDNIYWSYDDYYNSVVIADGEVHEFPNSNAITYTTGEITYIREDLNNVLHYGIIGTDIIATIYIYNFAKIWNIAHSDLVESHSTSETYSNYFITTSWTTSVYTDWSGSTVLQGPAYDFENDVYWGEAVDVDQNNQYQYHARFTNGSSFSSYISSLPYPDSFTSSPSGEIFYKGDAVQQIADPDLGNVIANIYRVSYLGQLQHHDLVTSYTTSENIFVGRYYITASTAWVTSWDTLKLTSTKSTFAWSTYKTTSVITSKTTTTSWSTAKVTSATTSN